MQLWGGAQLRTQTMDPRPGKDMLTGADFIGKAEPLKALPAGSPGFSAVESGDITPTEHWKFRMVGCGLTR